MIKFNINIENGRALNEVHGEMVTLREMTALFKVAGLSLGRFMRDLSREDAVTVVEALMDGLEEAKKEPETSK